MQRNVLFGCVRISYIEVFVKENSRPTVMSRHSIVSVVNRMISYHSALHAFNDRHVLSLTLHKYGDNNFFQSKVDVVSKTIDFKGS